MLSNKWRLAKPLAVLLAMMVVLGTANGTSGTAAANGGNGNGGAGSGGNGMSNPTIIHVSDYGAVPNDGIDDTAAIQSAIMAAAASTQIRTVAFDEGVYNLDQPTASNAMLHIANTHNLTLSGAVAPDGKPATVLEINLELANDLGSGSYGQISVSNSKKITLENFVLDYGPRFATAGEIVAVDPANDRVVVDIFPGMPHFEGMRAYSANNWDLASKQLIQVAALTIGTNPNNFTNTWQRIPGEPDNRYQLQGLGFADRVEVGQGISWHFNVDNVAPNLTIMHSQNITLSNIDIYNSLGMSMLAGFNKNITVQDVRVIPEGNSLAVGPRDAFHFSNNSGSLLIDGVHIKGVRWDPIVSRSTFIEVTDRISDYQVETAYFVGTFPIEDGDSVTFWAGDEPFERVILSAQRLQSNRHILTFADPLPGDVAVGARLTLNRMEWDEVTIRNTTVESNYGTSVIFMNKNLLIEDSVFRYNAYSDIGLGPTSVNTGPFARNVVIRNNLFEYSNWIQKYSDYDGTIVTFENHPAFTTEKYNSNIVIENNTFKDLDGGSHTTAIHIKNARNVELNGNVFLNVNRELKVNTLSTESVFYNGTPVVGDGSMPPGTVILNLDSPQYVEEFGNWHASSLRGYEGTPSRYSGTAAASATWTPDLEEGAYKVMVYKIFHASSEPASRLEVHHKNGVNDVIVDYTTGETGWVELGTYEFEEGTDGYVRLARESVQAAVGYIRTNAVAFVPAGN